MNSLMSMLAFNPITDFWPRTIILTLLLIGVIVFYVIYRRRQM